MAKFYKKTSEKLLNVFKKRILEASQSNIPLTGYKERRFQELFLAVYGKGNYKIENKSNVYVKSGGVSWIYLCQIKVLPSQKKSELTIKEIAENHASEYMTSEKINDERRVCYFKENTFYTPQLFTVDPVGLNWNKANKECDWIISDYEHKKTGAQFHEKASK